MERTEIPVGSRHIESMGELLIGVEDGRLEFLFGTDDVMRHIVAIRPCDGRAGRDRCRCWREAEVVDRYFVRGGNRRFRLEWNLSDRNRMVHPVKRHP